MMNRRFKDGLIPARTRRSRSGKCAVHPKRIPRPPCGPTGVILAQPGSTIRVPGSDCPSTRILDPELMPAHAFRPVQSVRRGTGPSTPRRRPRTRGAEGPGRGGGERETMSGDMGMEWVSGILPGGSEGLKIYSCEA
jgi:hypothetical protein